MSASASSEKSGASGTATGRAAFMRANSEIMPNVGSAYATASPGSQNARSAESMTSSEPQPVVTFSGATPCFRASTAFSSSANTDG